MKYIDSLRYSGVAIMGIITLVAIAVIIFAMIYINKVRAIDSTIAQKQKEVYMTKSQDFKLPPLASFGIRVRDLDKAIDIYSSIFGPPFQIAVFEPDKHWYKGKPYPIKLRIASFQVGTGIKMDIIEDLENGPHQWRIDEKGEGPDYLAFHVDDYDTAIANMQERGFGILANAETTLNVKVSEDAPAQTGFLRAAYMESNKLNNLLIEIAHLE